jgi:hypothetical protein
MLRFPVGNAEIAGMFLNAAGEFQFETVPSGQYSIKVTSRGFSPMEQTGTLVYAQFSDPGF